MQEAIGLALMFIGMCLIVFGNVIWYQGKFALERKGYPVSYFFRHFRDFKMIDKAVSEETDPTELDRLRLIQKRMKSLWVIIPIAFLTFFIGVRLASITN